MVKVSAYNAGDLGSIPGSGRSPGEEKSNPLQYSCLENSMDGGAWWATLYGVTKSQTQLSNFTFTFFFFKVIIGVYDVSDVLGSPVLPPHEKSWLIGKDSDAGRGWGQEEKGTTEDEMAGWHHWLDGGESEWTPGVGDGQGGLACCDSWGPKESDMTERLIWSDLITTIVYTTLQFSSLLFCTWFSYTIHFSFSIYLVFTGHWIVYSGGASFKNPWNIWRKWEVIVLHLMIFISCLIDLMLLYCL